MEMTHLGSGICSQSRRITGAIFCETRPAMIIRSAWRGEGRNTSAPKRAMSKRDAPMAIISMAQQAKPKVMGQMELLRHQFTAQSSEVKMIPSGGCSPKATSRILVISCSLPTVFSKRSSPFMFLLYSERRGRFQLRPGPGGHALRTSLWQQGSVISQRLTEQLKLVPLRKISHSYWLTKFF